MDEETEEVELDVGLVHTSSSLRWTCWLSRGRKIETSLSTWLCCSTTPPHSCPPQCTYTWKTYQEKNMKHHCALRIPVKFWCTLQQQRHSCLPSVRGKACFCEARFPGIHGAPFLSGHPLRIHTPGCPVGNASQAWSSVPFSFPSTLYLLDCFEELLTEIQQRYSNDEQEADKRKQTND